MAAVELGLLIFPLVLLAFGITEFGRAIYEYNALTKATRDATRFLSSQSPGDPNDITTAKCLAVYGNKACTSPALAPNLTMSMVTVCDSSNCADHQAQPTRSGVINLVSRQNRRLSVHVAGPARKCQASLLAELVQRCGRYYENSHSNRSFKSAVANGVLRRLNSRWLRRCSLPS